MLVSNRLAYTLTFSKKNFQSDEELNAAIWRLIALCQETDTAWVDTLPISQNSPYLYWARWGFFIIKWVLLSTDAGGRGRLL